MSFEPPPSILKKLKKEEKNGCCLLKPGRLGVNFFFQMEKILSNRESRQHRELTGEGEFKGAMVIRWEWMEDSGVECSPRKNEMNWVKFVDMCYVAETREFTFLCNLG